MCGIIMTWNGDVTPIKDFDLKSMQTAVNGFIEVVHLTEQGQLMAQSLLDTTEKLVMIVNEEGLIHGLPHNVPASMMHGKLIVGNAILCPYSVLN